MPITRRSCRGGADLLEVGRLIKRAFGEDPRWNLWSPARFDIWAQRRIADETAFDRHLWRSAVCIWEDERAAIRGAATFGDGASAIHCRPQDAALLPDLLGWLETRFDGRDPDGRPLIVEASSGNPQLEALLAARGFHRPEEHVLHRWKSLAGTPAEPVSLPPGFAIRPLAGEHQLPERFDAVHAVFGMLDHVEAYRCLQQAPSYVPDLDLVALNEYGKIAAFCTIWVDDANSFGDFEPVGTLPHARRRGLARALLAEGCNRLRVMGVAAAAVHSWSGSPDASALYEASGLVERNRGYSWVRPLTPPATPPGPR